MTHPYMFKWFPDGKEAVAPVRLNAEPRVGSCVYIAGERYKILTVDNVANEIWIAKPEPGYVDPFSRRNRNSERRRSLPSTRNRSLQ